jgi:serine/threonine protein kinase
MTQAGLILGTAAYMSPEQAKGRLADKRSDVWAFGCVLFEMLAGRRVFQGDDVTDVLVAVLSQEPDWTALPAATPPAIHRVLRRSRGRQSFGTPDYQSFDHYRSEWMGTGLQGELTAGYEFARATSLRMFVQTDVVLPFYQVSSQTFSRFGPTGSVDRRYAPSLVVSIGLGR